MLRVMLHALIVAMAVFAPASLAADPICLGQAVLEIEGEISVIEDPEWEGHGWVYTTTEGAKVNACLICLDGWERVPEWVAGLERICEEPWKVCQGQILRCPTVIGC